MVPVAVVLAVGSPQFSPVTIRPANVVPLLKDEPPFQVAAFHPPGRDLEVVGFDERKALFRVRADSDGSPREYWDEFAGVVAFGGWLGVYEEHLVYPERLVVAMINGKDDDGARENEARDRETLSRFGVTSKVFRFKGGHTIPPRATLDQALDWMARQWASEPAPAVDPAGRLRDAVEAAAEGRPREAVEACLDLILEHASSLEAQAAEDLLTSLLAPADRGPSLQLKHRGPRAATVLYGKARGASGAPERTAAYLEAGLLLAPDDGLIQSRLAFELSQRDPASTRARELAQKALTTAPEHWLSHFVWGLLRDADGNRAEAASAVRKARSLAPNALQPLCTQVLQSWGEP